MKDNVGPNPIFHQPSLITGKVINVPGLGKYLWDIVESSVSLPCSVSMCFPFRHMLGSSIKMKKKEMLTL